MLMREKEEEARIPRPLEGPPVTRRPPTRSYLLKVLLPSKNGGEGQASEEYSRFKLQLGGLVGEGQGH